MLLIGDMIYPPIFIILLLYTFLLHEKGTVLKVRRGTIYSNVAIVDIN